MQSTIRNIFILSIVIFIPTWFVALVPENTGWLVSDLSLMLQGLLIAILVWKLTDSPYIKVISFYLIIYRIVGLIAIYINYKGTEADHDNAMILSYGQIGLLILAVLHPTIKYLLKDKV